MDVICGKWMLKGIGENVTMGEIKDRASYEEFLMHDLNDLMPLFEDHNVRSYVAFCTMAAGGEKLCETTLNFYLSQLAIDTENLVASGAYFFGSGLIEVQCTCEGTKGDCLIERWADHPSFQAGLRDCAMGADQFLKINTEIDDLRKKLRF